MSKKLHLGTKTPSKNLDRQLFYAVIALCLFGLIAVFNASLVSAFRDFGDQYYFVKDQAVFATVGIVLMFMISFINYRRLYEWSAPLLIVTLVLLVAVFIPGIGIGAMGARRWINLGFTTLQPTEFAKLTLVIYLSAWFAYKEHSRLKPFLLLLAIVLGLVILQPDLGTAIIISIIGILMYFISGASIVHFLLMVPVALVGVIVLAIAAPYRLQRVVTFFNHNTDPLGASYHIRQVLIALGSGGLFGLGLGKSRQKFEYLPEASTDSIFAIIAEEIGFFGSLLLIGAYIFILYRIFTIASQAPDRFGRFLASGVGIWFAIQVAVNLASMVALVPLTGVPLPFISYGGSNLMTLLLGMGIVLSVSRQTRLNVKLKA